jgi:hypothetical protein
MAMAALTERHADTCLLVDVYLLAKPLLLASELSAAVTKVFLRGRVSAPEWGGIRVALPAKPLSGGCRRGEVGFSRATAGRWIVV